MRSTLFTAALLLTGFAGHQPASAQQASAMQWNHGHNLTSGSSFRRFEGCQVDVQRAFTGDGGAIMVVMTNRVQAPVIVTVMVRLTAGGRQHGGSFHHIAIPVGRPVTAQTLLPQIGPLSPSQLYVDVSRCRAG